MLRRHTGREGVPVAQNGRASVIVALAALLFALSGCAGTPPGTTTHVVGSDGTNAVSMLISRPAGPPPLVSYGPPLPSLPAMPSTSASAAILMNPDTGGVYLEKDADEPRAMASTTKIMTAIVAVSYGNLNQRITVGPDSMLPVAADASVMGLHTGETFTLGELLYGLLLPSGDDAAIAIADGVAGSQVNFVLLMNSEAQLLGLRHTHYVNVHGLDQPDQYSSAADLARLAARALDDPTIAEIMATPTVVLPASADHPEFTLRNTNELLFPPVYPGITGVKTGFTGDAGYCLVFSATGPTGSLIGVVMGEHRDLSRFVDARAMLDWGFALQKRIKTLRHFSS